MAHSTRTLRILGASFVALIMVAGSYTFSGPNPFFGLGRIAEAQSAEALLKEYATKDSDADGLPDWQEALYGTDPYNPESFEAGILDGEAVAQGLIEPRVMVRDEPEPTDLDSIPGTLAAPTTLTDRFARTVLAQYLQNRGEARPTSDEITEFVKAGVASLTTESISPARYANTDLRVSAGSLAVYAAQMETAFANNTVSTQKNELSYFSDALKGDSAALAKIKDISAAYVAIASAVIETPVPAEARQAHLSVANALVHMSEINADMATMDSDPVRALVGIGLYDRYAQDLIAAFSHLHGVFSARQVSIPEGTAGYYIVKTAADAAASR